jgi:DNA mismatch endonuclease (patch repair protein)
MKDFQASKERSRIMRAIKSKDTTPEMVVRRLIFSKGFRFRLHDKTLPGKPDIIFKSMKKIIFVHGCFWHGHDCKRGARIPKKNREYWTEKIRKNVARDSNYLVELKKLGWDTMIIWECELKDIRAIESNLMKFLG